MDELEISGKRYISTRLAARQHHYHSDYIGQLIRAGKVTGQKVGRSWYVEAQSLSAYLGQESAPTALAAEEPISERPITHHAASVTEESHPAKQEKKEPEMPSAFPSASLMPRPLQTNHPHRPADASDEETHPIPVKKVSAPARLRYISEEEETPHLPVMESPVARAVSPAREDIAPVIPRQTPARRRFVSGFIVLGAGVIALIFVALASGYVASVTTITGGQSASTGYAFGADSASF